MLNQTNKSILWGIMAAGLLLIFYFLVLDLVSGPDFALAQFFKNWYWIAGLTLGFGAQIALFTYLRAVHRRRVSVGAVAASGTASTLAMISCCAHYLINILPVIGVSGLALFAGRYQTEIFFIGLLSNLLGLAYLLNKLLRAKKLMPAAYE